MCQKGEYWPTCLLCCLVLRRTICRMLELVMSDTTSDTRFHTRSRVPHNMWYWRRRMPCRHSWPSSIFLHFPFLRRKEQVLFLFFSWILQKAISVQQANFLLTDCFVQEFYNTSVVMEAHESPAGYFFTTKPQVICKSLGMASGLKSTWNEPKQVPARLDALSTINPKRHSRLLLTSWHGYTSWRRRWTGSPSCPWLPLESPEKGNVWHQYQQRAHCVQSLT